MILIKCKNNINKDKIMFLIIYIKLEVYYNNKFKIVMQKMQKQLQI